MTFLSAVPLLQSDIGGCEILVGLLSEATGSGFNTGLTATAVDRIFLLLWAFLFVVGFKMIFAPFHQSYKI